MREDRAFALAVIAVLAVAALFYSVWSMTGQRPPDDLPRCAEGQTLSIEDPSQPVCR